MIRSRAAAVLAALVAVLPAAGCYQGFDTTVNSQPPTGNGTDFRVGDLKVQDTTLVSDGSGQAALLVTVVNEGEVDDALVAVSTDPASTSDQSGELAVASGRAVQVGNGAPDSITLRGLTVPAGSYATVTFSFREAGQSTQQVLVVPAAGYYEGLGPSAQPSNL